MGQKVHPIGFRPGVVRTWISRWYAEKNYGELLHEDIHIRTFLKKRLYNAGISRIEIERTANRATIDIYTARPGIVIGKKGAEIDTLRDELQKMTGRDIVINIKEVRKAEIDAQLVKMMQERTGARSPDRGDR